MASPLVNKALYCSGATTNKTPKRRNGASFEQVAKVMGVVIPLSMIIGFCEEFAFRGLLPLIIAAKTGLPTAGVVVLSGLIFGVSGFTCRDFSVSWSPICVPSNDLRQC